MNFLERLRKTPPPHGSHAPVILDFGRKEDIRLAEELFDAGEVASVVDEWAEQERELALVKKPKLLAQGGAKAFGKGSVRAGRWIYFPWRKALVHLLAPAEYRRLRVSRNFNLIRPAEQKKFEKIRVGIAGLNVGNPAALCLVLEGISRMKFADNDHLSVSNLNRFRAGVSELGVNKAILSARQAYEVDPYADIEVYPKGITPENMKAFLAKPKIDVLIEEMDNLGLKIAIREEARRARIPVVMVTGNGENVIVDVERFDKEPELPLLSGRLRPKVIGGIRALGPSAPFRRKLLLARDFMGAAHLHPRLRQSFLQVGETLAGIPQIAESSFLRGAAAAYAVRALASGASVRSGRYNVRLEDLFR